MPYWKLIHLNAIHSFPLHHKQKMGNGWCGETMENIWITPVKITVKKFKSVFRNGVHKKKSNTLYTRKYK